MGLKLSFRVIWNISIKSDVFGMGFNTTNYSISKSYINLQEVGVLFNGEGAVSSGVVNHILEHSQKSRGSLVLHFKLGKMQLPTPDGHVKNENRNIGKDANVASSRKRKYLLQRGCKLIACYRNNKFWHYNFMKIK